MKQRILTAFLAVLCALTLFSTGFVPAYAYTSDGESGAVTQAEEVCWVYRVNHGVNEMRLWSITYAEWVTDWIPVPDGWVIPGT